MLDGNVRKSRKGGRAFSEAEENIERKRAAVPRPEPGGSRRLLGELTTAECIQKTEGVLMDELRGTAGGPGVVGKSEADSVCDGRVGVEPENDGGRGVWLLEICFA